MIHNKEHDEEIAVHTGTLEYKDISRSHSFHFESVNHLEYFQADLDTNSDFQILQQRRPTYNC